MSKPPGKVPAEAKLDEALADSFPASDPPAMGHSERVGDPRRQFPVLNQRARKAIGTFATVFFLILYSLIVMAVGGQLIVGRGVFLELLFYAIAGIAWLPAVMIIVKWMTRPESED